MTVATELIDRTDPLLACILAGIPQLETYLGPEDNWIEDDRRALYELADRFLRPLGRPAIRKRGQRDYLTTVGESPRRRRGAASRGWLSAQSAFDQEISRASRRRPAVGRRLVGSRSGGDGRPASRLLVTGA